MAVTGRSDEQRMEAALVTLARHCGVAADGTGDGAELVADIEAAVAEMVHRAADATGAADRMRAALTALGVGVIICDEQGEEVYRNQAAAGAAGRLGDRLAERTVDDLLDEALRGSCLERSLELFSPAHRDLLLRAFPIANLHGPLGAVVILEDVSERRRLESIRRDFVANVSHELKTPVGALSLLAETLDGEDDPEVISRLAARVGAEADRLGRIIDDLLDLSRIEGNEAPGLSPVSVRDMVDEAVEPLRSVAVATGIVLKVEEPPAHVTVPGDRRDLVSAVSNLVDNAIKYSEQGGTVWVKVASDDGRIRIEVVDQGIGIPAGDRERIFERFYRVDRARSRLTGGTGLGLSIVRHVAANHGGEVSLESREGVGSTFTLLLPSEPPAGREGLDG